MSLRRLLQNNTFSSLRLVVVLLAAAAHLAIFQGKDRFTEREWEDLAKTANSWKAKWARERAKTIKRLVDGAVVVENAAGVYSISQSFKQTCEAKLV